ncbi:hypothetical protein BMF81_03428 [Nodularia spumigena UHCC 0039]|mgnify:CR=1 FL=1|jgi:hypothetical protein|uniref:Uncharacterized protein n=1 Tax=Nodularia spumigena UHCC 0039 TaxID=1914872 RepID=A0A2S0Q9T8_NODSP|nr:hypothetical protein BMF81_03428 [Nodularia spumigena UHCC 0039]
MLSPPYILLLLCDSEGDCQISDPKQGDKVIFSSNNYDVLTNMSVAINGRELILPYRFSCMFNP